MARRTAKLKSETLQLIDQLGRVEWFAHVGEPIDNDEIARVFTWNDAVHFCRERYSSNVQMEARNLLTEHLSFEFPERYQSWNSLARPAGDLVEELLRRKVTEIVKTHRLPKAFVDTIGWDLHAMMMELEYGDLVPPRFFAERAKWYLAGHFPCGWVGDFPVGGKLVVF